MEEKEYENIDVSGLAYKGTSRDISRKDDLEKLSTEKYNVTEFLDKGETAVKSSIFGMFSNYYHKFFNNHPQIDTIYVTNEKKASRLTSTIYYLSICRKKITYQTDSKTESNFLFFNFQTNELRTKQQPVMSESLRTKFFKDLQTIGRQIKHHQAYVFETRKGVS